MYVDGMSCMWMICHVCGWYVMYVDGMLCMWMECLYTPARVVRLCPLAVSLAAFIFLTIN